jgi:hypothetical protein
MFHEKLLIGGNIAKFPPKNLNPVKKTPYRETRARSKGSACVKAKNTALSSNTFPYTVSKANGGFVTHEQPLRHLVDTILPSGTICCNCKEAKSQQPKHESKAKKKSDFCFKQHYK